MAVSATAWCTAVNGFVVSTVPILSAPRVDGALFMASQQETPCDIPNDIVHPALVSQKGSGKLMRDAMLTDVNGDTIKLGDKMGRGTSVVVFLRHMGWPYCWSYAKEWSELQPKIEASGATGPIFISIGDEEKLNKFLELNPAVQKDSMFVDGYDFDAYNAVGFGSLGESMDISASDIKMTAPELGGFGGWWKYISNVMSLSPVEPGKSGIPEGVKRLGGTFVVKGDDVVYQWYDKVPGDHPDLNDVMKVVQDA